MGVLGTHYYHAIPMLQSHPATSHLCIQNWTRLGCRERFISGALLDSCLLRFFLFSVLLRLDAIAVVVLQHHLPIPLFYLSGKARPALYGAPRE